MLGSTVTRMGGAGAGQVVKACNQLVVALVIEAVSEALVLGSTASVDPEVVIGVLSGGLAGHKVMEVRGRHFLEHDFKPGFKVDLHHKDLGIALETARACGAVLPATAAVEQMLESLRLNGWGRDDHSRLRPGGGRWRSHLIPCSSVWPMSLTDAELRVCDAIRDREDELVRLASALIGFDTSARAVGDPPREEAALQEYLGERLRAARAEVEIWEPDGEALHGRPLVPSGIDFAGRPQLIARRRGRGTGRSLVLNGHIDVVSAKPLEPWTSDPFTATVHEGKLYGRGACDMKGGIASMVFAVETLASLGVELAGELLVATNTDEESSGAGGTALVERGLRADAGIVTEPTGFDAWVACRGSEYGVFRVPGRPGHAEVRQPDWRDGGAVNAIEKAAVVLDAIRSLRREWSQREGLEHPFLSRPTLLPTMARAGEWPVSYPASCELTVAVMYLPAQADARGWGADVRAEVERWIARETAGDDWLAEHPPVVDWWSNGVMPLEIPVTEPIVETVLGATGDVGRPGRLGGLDSWYDGATLTHFAGIPSIGFGPPGFSADGLSIAHTVDEFVPIDGLVECAQALAVAAMRFCGM